MSFTLHDLEKIIAQKASVSPDMSYTARLLENGGKEAAKKLGEEAVEAAIAAVTKDNEELTKEAADVLYHLLVVLYGAGLSIDDVLAELARRTGQSGLAEKASRKR